MVVDPVGATPPFPQHRGGQQTAVPPSPLLQLLHESTVGQLVHGRGRGGGRGQQETLPTIIKVPPHRTYRLKEPTINQPLWVRQTYIRFTITTSVGWCVDGVIEPPLSLNGG